MASMPPTKSSVKVLAAFLEKPRDEQYGFGLMKSTGVKSGSLYPMLERLERLGWIESHDECIDEQAEGRPRRRLYRLTGLGERVGRRVVADFYHDLGPIPEWLPGYEGG
jgi:PadR family transcriptional regulator, regulatory protein PadR